MDTRTLALAAHLLGVILWIGGGVAAATMAAFAADSKEGAATGLQGAQRALSWWVTPGMLLAWAGGLTILIPDFATHYASAGWMHGKLTLLLALSGVTGVLSGRLRKAAKGQKEIGSKLLNGLSIGLMVGAFVVLVLVLAKPGA